MLQVMTKPSINVRCSPSIVKPVEIFLNPFCKSEMYDMYCVCVVLSLWCRFTKANIRHMKVKQFLSANYLDFLYEKEKSRKASVEDMVSDFSWTSGGSSSL